MEDLNTADDHDETWVWEGELGELRAELDTVDSRILDAVRDRIAVCIRVGELKRRHGIPTMQPDRVGFVQRRAQAYGTTHGVSAKFLASLYELLVAEACRVEDEVIESGGVGEESVEDLFDSSWRPG